jgi:hypothetical protein
MMASTFISASLQSVWAAIQLARNHLRSHSRLLRNVTRPNCDTMVTLPTERDRSIV